MYQEITPNIKGPYGLKILPVFTAENGILEFPEELVNALGSFGKAWRIFGDAEGSFWKPGRAPRSYWEARGRCSLKLRKAP